MRMTRSGLIHFALLALFASGTQVMAAPRPAARTPGTITPAQLVGRWGDNGDCSKDVIFRRDGTFRSYTGGEGRWRLNGERLTMTGDNATTVLMVRRIARDRVRIANPDGSVGFSQRC